MDDIKTNFEKIMEQFSESISPHGMGVPKKLSFEYLGDSFQSNISKKRKLSSERNDSNSAQLGNTSIGLNSSSESFNSSLVASPWETRRLKADYLEAKARIVKLKSEINQQHKLRSDIEILYNSKVTELKKQCEFSCSKVLDMEKHLNSLRRREGAAKAELTKVKTQLSQQKELYEDTIYNLQKKNMELEENSRILENRLTNDSNEQKRQIEKLQMELDLTGEELDNFKFQQDAMQNKASAFDDVVTELEDEKQEHEVTKAKLKKLEYDLESYGEWKDISKTSMTRLATLPDLEREIMRLQKDNKNLRDNIGNKLLLEEQVFDLKCRLESNEQDGAETAALRVQVANLEREIENWKLVAKDHCLANTPINPVTLRSRIEQILQKDLILISEKGNSKSEKDTFQSQLQELKTQNDIYTKANSDMKAALKHRETIMMRAKKKLVMVAKERDCYKQLVENFEKDLTISGALAEAMNPDSQLRSRLEVLEKTLIGYKEMCSNLERELESVQKYPELPSFDAHSESYDRLKKEIEHLRIENDRLKRRKEELELEMEHRCLKGDFNIDKFKVVHLTMNPAAEAYENSKNAIEKLQTEIERLKRKNRKLEEAGEEMTTRLNDTTNITANVQEVNSLRAQLESLESKMLHLKEVYKSASFEFREVCYMLFGYRIDRVGNTNYRISSMYADSEGEYMNFRLNESGILDMLETEYSISLAEMMRTHLAAHRSLPAFLSSLTLELFNRTTVMV